MGNTIREVASYRNDVTIKPLDCRELTGVCPLRNTFSVNS